MDWVLKQTFNHFLKAFCEPLEDNDIQVSLREGIVVRDLIIRPEAINEELAKNKSDLRVDGGRIDFLRVCYTAMPGVVTMQMSGVDVRVRPNALKTIGKVVKKGFTDLLFPSNSTVGGIRDRNDYYYLDEEQEFPFVAGDGRIILDPHWHDPRSCAYHRCVVDPQTSQKHHYYCSKCCIPYHKGRSAVFHIINVPETNSRMVTYDGEERDELPTMDVDSNELRFVSEEQVNEMIQGIGRRTNNASSRYKSDNVLKRANQRVQRKLKRKVSHHHLNQQHYYAGQYDAYHNNYKNDSANITHKPRTFPIRRADWVPYNGVRQKWETEGYETPVILPQNTYSHNYSPGLRVEYMAHSHMPVKSPTLINVNSFIQSNPSSFTQTTPQHGKIPNR